MNRFSAISPGALSSRPGEVAVVGLGRSGVSAARLLVRAGNRVYASDAGTSAELLASAASLREEGIDAELGSHNLERIAAAAAVVTSPGIPPHASALRAASEAGVPVVGELEIGLRALPATRVIAVTGTNGKTTTTALTGRLLRAVGRRAVEGGNIGMPLCSYALDDTPPEWVALELSSFQLRHVPSLMPAAGVVTNLASDHLDWYETVNDYWADKARIFYSDSAASCWVLNGDEAEVMKLHERLPEGHASRDALRGTVRRFSLKDATADAFYNGQSGAIELLGEHLLNRTEFPLLGDHNVANALSAALAVACAHTDHATREARSLMAAALRTAGALPHRMEPVGEFDGVLWINDSKATNVSSTLVAIEGMTRPYVLLLGGRHKGESYAALAEPFARHGKFVIAYGEAGARVQADLSPLLPVEVVEGDFGRVLERARALALEGDAVLLSPACSSYDMFRNYEERGAAFRQFAERSQ